MRTGIYPLIGLLAAMLIGILAACSADAGDPAAVIESYLQALASRDSARMIANSCADWESEARLEHDAFAAVTLELQDVACMQNGEQGDAAVVTCSGSILANYGAEDLQIDVAERAYLAVREGGEWRMCGYTTQP